MKTGDKIRLVRVPPHVKDDSEFKTRTILTKCVGRVFTVKGFQRDGGRFTKQFSPGAWVELDIADALPGSTDTIWVNPEYVELLTKQGQKRKR